MSIPTAIVFATADVYSVCHWCLALSLRTENVCLMSYMAKAAVHLAKMVPTVAASVKLH